MANRRSGTNSLFAAQSRKVERMMSLKKTLQAFKVGSRKFGRSASDVGEIGKPYQNVFNGGTSNSRLAAGSDAQFDENYTEKLRRLSENQFHSKSTTNLVKPNMSRQQGQVNVMSPQTPTSYPSPPHSNNNNVPKPAAHEPQNPMQIQPQQQQQQILHHHRERSTNAPSAHHRERSTDAPSTHHRERSNDAFPSHHRERNNDLPPEHSARVISHVPPQRLSVSATAHRQPAQSHVLETEIDNSPEDQPQPPPRPRATVRDGTTESQAPPKPPKLSTYNSQPDISNRNEHSKSRTTTAHKEERTDIIIEQNSSINHSPKPIREKSVLDQVTSSSGKPEPSRVEPYRQDTYQHHSNKQTDSSKIEQYKQSRLHAAAAATDTSAAGTPVSDVSKPESQKQNPRPSKDRRSNSVSSITKSSPKHSVGEDLTITSGDPTVHLIRRQSIGKNSHRRRSSQGREDTTSNQSQSSPSAEEQPASVMKPSPTTRAHPRETSFTSEKTTPEVPKPTDRSPVTSRQNKPVPFDRYNPGQKEQDSSSTSHSRQASAEILDIVSQSEASYSKRKSIGSPVAAVRHGEPHGSPTPPPRSSPLASRSSKTDSPMGSRKSTPSPNYVNADLKIPKSDPPTPVDKNFVPISKEILDGLTNQGIDITEKHKCISDESKVRLVQLTSLSSSPPPSKSKKTTPSIKHIRQKSTDELLCDHQVENIGKSLKDETLSQVLTQPQKGTTDYLPGLFDDVLTKEIPRKPRTSVDGSSPCHSKQNSEGETRHSKLSSGNNSRGNSPDELTTVQEKRDELLTVLRKKLSVLKQDQQFLQQEMDENDESGEKVCKFVEQKCEDREVRKYKSFIEEIEKVTRLLLNLSRRLARAENELRNAPMDATDDDKKSLEQKRNNLQQQHEDAKMLKESIDKKKLQVLAFLEKSLSNSDLELYDTFVSTKLKLIMESSDIDDQIIHCEEQLAAVNAFSS